MSLQNLYAYVKSWSGSDWALSWIIFFSIFYQKLVPIGFLLWILVLYKDWKYNSVASFLKTLLASPGFLFITYYLLLLAGMFWTENTTFGLAKLENKLSFLLLPILLLGTNSKIASGDWKNTFLFALITTVVLYEMLAFFHSMNAPETSPFMYFRESHFTLFMHRSYFACYLTIGVVLLLEKVEHERRVLNVILLLLLSVAAIQTFSKAGIIALTLVFSLYAFVKLYKHSILMSFCVLGALILSFFYVWKSDNLLSIRFKTMKAAMEEIEFSNNPSIESNASRLLMWNSSVEVIRENPIFGVGTGDYDDALASQNEKRNNAGVLKLRLNSHNQFLNTWIQLGFIGFVVLTLLFIIPFAGSVNFYKSLILLTFLINFLFESFLETQAGIILFCTFMLLLFTPKNRLESHTTEIRTS